MDVFDAIRGRRAVRAYQDRPVDREVLRSLVEAAVWAPSGMNRQPWSFLVVDDAAELAACAAAAKALILGAGSLPEPMRATVASDSFDIFYGAPAWIVICATAEDEMARTDCCLAAQNLMLAAHALGLGACWIGFSEAWLATPEGRARLGVPNGLTPVAPIIVGHPATAPSAPPRRAPDIRYWGEGTPSSGPASPLS